MFYDNFTEDQICGVFTWGHFLAMFLVFGAVILALAFSRKLGEKGTKRTFLIIAIVVTVLEAIKIIIRICKGEGADGWVPLYFCSLFIYSLWLVNFKNQHLKNCGYCFMVFGGIVGGIANTIYPSTSLLLYPLWHPGCLHSLIYHGLMIYTGVLVLMKKLYTPKAWHFVYYFSLLTVCSGVACIINQFAGSNLMFLSNPFGLDFLMGIYNYSKVLYGFLAYFAQTFALFWAVFGVYKLVIFLYQKYKLKIKENTNGNS